MRPLEEQAWVDRCAMAAMQGLLANPDEDPTRASLQQWAKDIAEASYAYAFAMLDKRYAPYRDAAQNMAQPSIGIGTEADYDTGVEL